MVTLSEMMSNVPKIVHDRLRAGALEGAHPDPDLLTAFAEQALSATERERMLQHLALCQDCREVVALSIPPMEAVIEPAVAREGETAVSEPVSAGRAGGWRTWFALPALRWAALAAGVVVVATVLLLRPGKPNQPMVASVTRQAENALPNTYAAKTAEPPAEQPAPSVPVKREVARAMIGPPLPTSSRSAPAPAQLAQAKPEMVIEDGRRKDLQETDKLATATASPGAPAMNAPAGKSASETIQVNGAVAVTTEAASLEDHLVARNEVTRSELARNESPLPIEKAKPPLKDAEAKEVAVLGRARKQADTSASNLAFAGVKSLAAASPAKWTLSAGSLQRSLDGGASWQNVLGADRPLLCFASRESEVWAGGRAGALFHSADGGATWTRVRPSTKDQLLKADIVGIEVRDPAQIILSTSSGETWTTSDNGKNWAVK